MVHVYTQIVGTVTQLFEFEFRLGSRLVRGKYIMVESTLSLQMSWNCHSVIKHKLPILSRFSRQNYLWTVTQPPV